MPAEVLVVDDDPAFRFLIAEVVTAAGLAVRSVGSAEEGLAAALADRPRLVVTDVHLPGRSGFVLCRQVKGHPLLKGVRVLVVTGTYDPEEAGMLAAADGADAYLAKPFHLPELMAVIRRLSAPA